MGFDDTEKEERLNTLAYEDAPLPIAGSQTISQQTLSRS